VGKEVKESISIFWHFTRASEHQHPMRKDINDTAYITPFDCMLEDEQYEAVAIEQLDVLVWYVTFGIWEAAKFGNTSRGT
jgi:hypothetical protein